MDEQGLEKKLIIKADGSWEMRGEVFKELQRVIGKLVNGGVLKLEDISIEGFNVKYE